MLFCLFSGFLLAEFEQVYLSGATKIRFEIVENDLYLMSEWIELFIKN
jgi:hypothetical protein